MDGWIDIDFKLINLHVTHEHKYTLKLSFRIQVFLFYIYTTWSRTGGQMIDHMLLYTTRLYQFKLTFVLTSPRALCDSVGGQRYESWSLTDFHSLMSVYYIPRLKHTSLQRLRGDAFIITWSLTHSHTTLFSASNMCTTHVECHFSCVWASGAKTQLIYWQDYYSKEWLKSQLRLWNQKGVCVPALC